MNISEEQIIESEDVHAVVQVLINCCSNKGNSKNKADVVVAKSHGGENTPAPITYLKHSLRTCSSNESKREIIRRM